MIPNDARRICARWIADPQEIKPGCLMPAFGLSDRQTGTDRRIIC